MSVTAYPTLRLKLTMPQALKLQFLPAIPGSNAAAAADRAEQAAQNAQDAANAAAAATTNKVDKSGDAMSGFLTLNADPTASLHAATKHYVDILGTSGIPEAPNDGSLYARQSLGWAAAQPLDADLTSLASAIATNAIYYRSAANTWSAVTIGSNLTFTAGTLAATGGSGGAPTTAEYITSTSDATLSAERVLTDTASITWDRTTAGQIKANTAAGGGNVSNSGTPTAGQYGKWVTATTIQGVAVGTVLTDIGAQPLDATLTSLAAYNTNGLLTQTAADTFTGRTLTGPAAGIAVTNGNGVSGNPTLALANDLAALEALAGTNNIYYRAGADTWSSVTIGTGLTFTGGTLNATGGGGGGFTASSTAPVSPNAGDHWYDLSTGVLSIYVNDGTSSQWVMIAPSGGGSATPTPPQGRLTLQTLTPVMTTTQSAKTTIYYTPYVGGSLPIYDGTSMVMTTFAELSAATTDTTKSPAAIGASKVNDWFVWSDAGTMRIGHGPDWTSDTARSAGTALVMVNGVLLNNVSITNGPAASRGTYVGTTRSNASSQLDWIFPAVAANWQAGVFGVWNMYNRVDVKGFSGDTTDSWTYAVLNTWRAANGNATARISFVRGLNEDAIFAHYNCMGFASAAGEVWAVGVGLNTTTGFSGTTNFTNQPQVNVGIASNYTGLGGLGYNYVSANEISSPLATTGTSTFYGDGGFGGFLQSGLHFHGRF